MVAAEDLSYTVSPETAGSKRLLKTLSMKRQGVPYEQSEYVSILSHDSQIERVIRIGIAENYDNCAIQDVVWYLNKEVTSLTPAGKALWDRVGGEVSKQEGGRSCFGAQPATVAELESAPENWKNLAVLFGAVVPFGVIFKRKGRK